MNDKFLLEDLLTSCKAQCGLFLHGTIEASDPTIREVFNKALLESLAIQNELAGKMSERGMYTKDTAQPTKVQETNSKWVKESQTE